MNLALKSASFASSPCSLRSISFFHSTPALERKRRTHWNPGKSSNKAKRCNYYARRANKMEKKMKMLRHISNFTDYLFESWRDEENKKSASTNDDTAWFRKQYWSKGAKVNGFSSNESQWGRYNNKRNGGFNFCESDDDIETILRSSFGRDEYGYWSFDSFEGFQWRNNHSRHSNYRTNYWEWRYETDVDELESPPQSNLTSERQALRLKPSGPLRLEEVKNAYRACALRWHPDRHQGSLKAAAEEKFKHCSAAYKTLCEKLAIQ